MYKQRSGLRARLLPILAALVFYTLPVSAEIYRWVDDQGRTHYGDRPVSGAEIVEIDMPPPPATTEVHVAKPPPKQPQTTVTLTASSLVRCLRSKGVKYYSASWCPQCAKQRKLFGRSERALPTVECSVDGARKQTRACERAGIEAYPTWIFPDGSRSTGVKSLATLARLSGCDAG